MLKALASSGAAQKLEVWPHRALNCSCWLWQVGPTLGGHLTPLQCGWLAAGGVLACIVYTLLLLPETLTSEVKHQVQTLFLMSVT